MGDDDPVGTSNRERRAAKQRRRDQKRGRTGTPTPTPDRGLSAEALRRVLTDTGTDLAAGHAEALTELRLLLTEHLARRREHVLTACDQVLDDPATPGGPDPTGDLEAVLGPAGDLATALSGHLASGGTATSWADATAVTAEIAAVATVGVLARRAVGSSA